MATVQGHSICRCGAPVLTGLSCYIFSATLADRSMIVPTIQIRKLRLREGTSLVQGHTADTWPNWNSYLGQAAPSEVPFIYL